MMNSGGSVSENHLGHQDLCEDSEWVVEAK